MGVFGAGVCFPAAGDGAIFAGTVNASGVLFSETLREAGDVLVGVGGKE